MPGEGGDGPAAGATAAEVREDDVHRHGDGERDDLLDGNAAWDEHGKAWTGESEECEPCDEEVEGCEGKLGKLEGWVGEDGFVGEDLEKHVLAGCLCKGSCCSIVA